MFGVSDVHADTVSTYRFVGREIATGAKRLAADTQSFTQAKAKDAANSMKGMQEGMKSTWRPGAGGGSTGAAAASPPQPFSPAPFSPLLGQYRTPPPSPGGAPGPLGSPDLAAAGASPKSATKAELAAAAEAAKKRGHGTFARLLAEKEASELRAAEAAVASPAAAQAAAAAPAALAVAADGFGFGGSDEFDSDSGGEGDGLLV